MNTQEPLPPTPEYRCPGQQHPISRAVHLGRLATFYPACRQCAHRDDTGTLSPRQVEQLQEVQSSSGPRSLFHDEGAGGVYLNDLTPAAVRQIAAAFAAMIRDGGRGAGDGRQQNLPSPACGRGAGGEGGLNNGDRDQPQDGDCPNFRVSENGTVPFDAVSCWDCSISTKIGTAPQDALTLALSQEERGPVFSQGERGPGSNPPPPAPNPSLLLAGDGRPITAELTAAVGEGLRWSGCNVIDIGPATAAYMAFAVHHLQAAGGILVGNHGQQPHIVGLQFWAAGVRPLSVGGSLEPIIARYQNGVDRPARGFGTLCRAAADVPYLATLAEHYHALRPLRVIVDSASRPLVEYLAKLTAAVACDAIPCRVAPHELPEQIRADAAHFGVCVDGDGETCRVLDEQGRAISAERLLLLLANGCSDDQVYSVSVVLENGISLPVIRQLERHGLDVVMSSPRRADMATAMQEHGAIFGGGPSGRFWFAAAGVPLPDALMAITRLLVILSRSDAPLSAVLDREAPLG